MFLVLDSDSELSLLSSVEAASAHLETIDLENNEYEMCDETGQGFTALILKPVAAFSGGDFRLMAIGLPDSELPTKFIDRAMTFWSQVDSVRTLDDARLHFQKT
jgi:hypothetical protein